MSMFEDYYRISAEYLNEISILLKDIEPHANGGDQKGQFIHLSNTLKGQMKNIELTRECINRIENCSPPHLSEESIPEKFSGPTQGQRRHSKKFAPHAKPKRVSLPTNNNAARHRQNVKKKRKIRSDANDGCTGKVKHTYDQAIQTGSDLLRNSTDPSFRRMAVYHCMKCGEHHLTRQIHSSGKKGSTQMAVIHKE